MQDGLMKSPQDMGFWEAAKTAWYKKKGLLDHYEKQQGRQRALELAGTKQTPYELDESQMFDSTDSAYQALQRGLPSTNPMFSVEQNKEIEAQNRAALNKPSLMNKGTGLIGGEITPKEFYSGLMGTSGYQGIGAQGLSSILNRGGAQKPTGLMQNMTAGGLVQGTQPYQDFMLNKLQQAPTQINLNNERPLGEGAINWVNSKGEKASPIMSIAQAYQQGFKYSDPIVKKEINVKRKTLDTMSDAVDAYAELAGKTGAVDILDKFKNPKKYNALMAAYTVVQLEYKNLAELGVLAGEDLRLIETVVQDPSSFTANAQQYAYGSNILPDQIKTIKRILEDAEKRAESMYGLEWRNAKPKQMPKPVKKGLMSSKKQKSIKEMTIKELEAIAVGK